jgi:hypothetical protein
MGVSVEVSNLTPPSRYVIYVPNGLLIDSHLPTTSAAALTRRDFRLRLVVKVVCETAPPSSHAHWKHNPARVRRSATPPDRPRIIKS